MPRSRPAPSKPVSRSRSLLLLGLVAISLGSGVDAGPAGPAASVAEPDYFRDIKPILQERCFTCHGPSKSKANLRLDRKAEALKGGDSGPVIVPGRSGESLLVERVSGSAEARMPPKGEPLSPKQIELLKKWIDQGAAWPDETDPRKSHWAFQPVRRPAPPSAAGQGWARNPIDQFVAAQLEKKGLKPSPEADRATLIRRLKFDLIGLPPTPEEVAAFVQDQNADAYERLVERYLASPHFGERWARRWLDVVRFAESTGFEQNSPRPNAWPYRDYVIRAFNEDKPYDRFIFDQLAGDAPGGESEATGFLVAGAFDAVKGDKELNAQQRADELHDMISVTGGAFLGLTFGCARCHDHKFDPISQTDYYALKAIFAGVTHEERTIKLAANRQREAEAEQVRRELADLEDKLIAAEPTADPEAKRPRRPAVTARANVEKLRPTTAKFLRMTILETDKNVEPCIDELEVFSEGKNIALASLGVKATASSVLPGVAIHKIEHLNDGRYGNDRSWISNEPGKGWVQLEFPQPALIDRIVWSRHRPENGLTDRVPTKYRFEIAEAPGEWRVVASSDDRLTRGVSPPKSEDDPTFALLAKKKALEARLRTLASSLMVYAGKFSQPGPTHRLHRGENAAPREEVAPGAPAAFGSGLALPKAAPEQARRIALAKWIADPQHPLTARVMANRLWQGHFGAGIVDTPSDLGLNGSQPTHPELLDWLAAEFVAQGWRMKPIHRLIVLSAAYRQASAADKAGLAADAGSRLLWRFPPRRLEAEQLRDAVLFVSGKLDLTMGGPGFELFEGAGSPQGVRVYVPKTKFGRAEWRRMIYFSKPRMQPDDTFGPFDCPDAGQAAPKRQASTSALQSLSLLNSPFMLQQASFFAERLAAEAGNSTEAQVRRGFCLAFQRPPEPEESEAAKKLIERHGLGAFCLALLNANEFLFVF